MSNGYVFLKVQNIVRVLLPTVYILAYASQPVQPPLWLDPMKKQRLFLVPAMYSSLIITTRPPSKAVVVQTVPALVALPHASSVLASINLNTSYMYFTWSHNSQHLRSGTSCHTGLTHYSHNCWSFAGDWNRWNYGTGCQC
jgi:hypothetical protein